MLTNLLKSIEIPDFKELRRTHSPVLRNFFALSTIQVFSYFLPLITMPYVVRTIGVSSYGALAFANAFVQYFVLLTNYGFNYTATRDVSIHKEDPDKLSRIVTSVVLSKCVLALCSCAVMGGCLLASATLRASWLVLVLSSTSLGATVLSMTWFFQGIERMYYITWLNILSKVAYTICLFTFVRGQSDYLLIPLLSGVAEIGAGVIGLFIAMKSGVGLLTFSREELRLQLRQGWHLFISTIAINAYTATPTVLVGLFTNPRITGLYAVAERLANAVQMFPLSPVLQALYPRLSNIYAKSPDDSYRLTARLQRLTTLAYVVALPCLILLAPFAVRLILGHAYAEAVIAFRLLLISVTVINSNAFRLQFLLVSGRHNIYARIHLVAGLLGGLLMFPVTYSYEHIGPPLCLIAVSAGVLFWCRREVNSCAEVQCLAPSADSLCTSPYTLTKD